MKKLIFLLVFGGALYWGFTWGSDTSIKLNAPSDNVFESTENLKKGIANAINGVTPFMNNVSTKTEHQETVSTERLSQEKSTPFQILDKTNIIIHFKESLESRLHRDSFVPEKDIPPMLKKALIATEDRRFYEHGAIDLIGITRAFITNYTAGRTLEGGSTISQQTVKNIFLSHDRTMTRKAEELLLAMALERDYTKDQILSIYMNTIYFGHGAYGIKEAAHTYFRKDVPQLTTAECAMLAGLPQAPSLYDPIDHPKEGRTRMETVLSLMVQEKYITEEESRKAFTSF